MEKAELEKLKEKVPCGAVLEHRGFSLDLKESTRKAMKYRRGDAIIIVIHDGKGRFDPLSDAKGDVGIHGTFGGIGEDIDDIVLVALPQDDVHAGLRAGRRQRSRRGGCVREGDGSPWPRPSPRAIRA